MSQPVNSFTPGTFAYEAEALRLKGLPRRTAAKQLGIPETSFRQMCASAGVTSWPNHHLGAKTTRAKGLRCVKGITGSIDELCRHFGVVGVATAYRRIKEGWRAADAVLLPRGAPKPAGTVTPEKPAVVGVISVPPELYALAENTPFELLASVVTQYREAYR
ncbi:MULTISPECIES: hypothetical protein [Pseudomonas]|uniref:RWP-RK domain-containing protein n=1 Tax=Pseudomonas lutea TaxID=243924 RepID=A0A9X8QLQ0_9PSED|nr:MULTISPECIES: hypothetical protein [Pseudomonas]SER36240.1 hypothetical protein SAMN05216409_11843 [Pseudomonas lutea]